MSESYIGEIRIWPCPRIPSGWLACQGQLLSISEYQALFTLIGTTYGGNGATTFGLPDLRGRLPVGRGQGPGLSNYPIGQAFGIESVSLTSAQTPAHSHAFNASTANAGNPSPTPSGTTVLANVGANNFVYEKGAVSGDTASLLAANSIAPEGVSQPHDNRMPVLALNYIISLYGIYPTPN